MDDKFKISTDKLSKKLDSVIELLQVLIILQASDMKINKKYIRRIAKTAMNRVTEITGFIKKGKQKEEKKIKRER